MLQPMTVLEKILRAANSVVLPWGLSLWVIPSQRVLDLTLRLPSREATKWAGRMLAEGPGELAVGAWPLEAHESRAVLHRGMSWIG